MRARRLRRALLQADFTLALTSRPTLFVVMATSALAAAAMYSEVLAVIFYLTYSLIYTLSAAVSTATSYLDEALTGRAQLYLAAGLSRGEYALSWILSAAIYPAAAVLLAVLLPLAVLNPRSLTEPLISPLDQLAAGMLARGLTLAVVLALDTLQLGSLLLFTASTTRRRGLVAAAGLAATLLLPLSAVIVMAATNSYGAASAVVISAVNVAYGVTLASSGFPGVSDPLWTARISLLVATATTAVYLAAAYKAMSSREY